MSAASWIIAAAIFSFPFENLDFIHANKRPSMDICTLKASICVYDTWTYLQLPRYYPSWLQSFTELITVIRRYDELINTGHVTPRVQTFGLEYKQKRQEVSEERREENIRDLIWIDRCVEYGIVWPQHWLHSDWLKGVEYLIIIWNSHPNNITAEKVKFSPVNQSNPLRCHVLSSEWVTLRCDCLASRVSK